MADINPVAVAPEIGLVNHYLKSMYFEADDSSPLKEERALHYDPQFNTVIDLLGRVFESSPRDVSVKHREAEPDLFEVTLGCQANSMCEENGKDMAVYDSQFVYAGLFRITGEWIATCASAAQPC